MPLITDVLRNFASRFTLLQSPPLIDRGFGLIYDVERDITWLKDANYAKTVGRSPDGQMNWYEATAWAGSLSYRGIRGWRLPSALNHDGSGPCAGKNCKDSEIGHLFLVAAQELKTGIPLINFQSNAQYWNSTQASATEVWGWNFFSLRQGTVAKDPFHDQALPGIATLTGPLLTWPVHDGDVSVEIVRRLITTGIRRTP